MFDLRDTDPRQFFDLARTDLAFQVVLASFLALVILAMMFMIVAVLLRVRNDRQLARRQRLAAVWEPVLLDVLSGKRPEADLHERVQRRDIPVFVDFLYRVGRRLRGEDLDVVRRIAQPYLPEVELITDGDAEGRARKIQIVGLLGFSDFADQVVASLDDRSPLVAMVAARTLIRREHPEYVSFVLARLDRFRDWSHDLLSSLLAGLGPGASPALREVLADGSREPWVRAAAARALASLNDATAADLAAGVLEEAVSRGEEAVGLREATLELLEKVGRDTHLPGVMAMLTDSDEDVRVAAYTALSRISQDSESDALLGALEDSSGRVALAAARGLRRVGRIDLLRELAAGSHPRSELIQQVLAERVSTLE